eukprot:INCI12360.1.p1 GENE.INCI12360.1~~INCI12360.1.p1  ORF type:complete len:364 (-),score=57.60 INCI12360.1:85-1176(-)
MLLRAAAFWATQRVHNTARSCVRRMKIIPRRRAGVGFSTSNHHGGLTLQQVLTQVSQGDLAVEDAIPAVRSLRATEGFERLGDFAHVDHDRAARTGMPEVIFSEGKTAQQVVSIFESLLARANGLAASKEGPSACSYSKTKSTSSSVILATRVSAEQYAEMQTISPDLPVDYFPMARMCISRCWRAETTHCADVEGCFSSDENREEGCVAELSSETRGHVVVVCAGTADLPVAEEAVLTAAAFGAHVDRVYDVGVAGIHRLLGNLDRMVDADVVICVAGMDGALPSVVGGLLDCPVIAVPTSVGYGAAFNGVAPLLTMLNSCASGVCVMNIDNGFGAATVAAKILRKMGRSSKVALSAALGDE